MSNWVVINVLLSDSLAPTGNELDFGQDLGPRSDHRFRVILVVWIGKLAEFWGIQF